MSGVFILSRAKESVHSGQMKFLNRSYASRSVPFAQFVPTLALACTLVSVFSVLGSLSGCGNDNNKNQVLVDATPKAIPDATSSTTPDAMGDAAETKPDAKMLTCEDLEQSYLDIVSKKDCVVATDCVVLFGACDVGLGGCYEIVNNSISQAQLEELRPDWSSLDCIIGRGVCDCAPAPQAEDLQCISGACVWQ